MKIFSFVAQYDPFRADSLGRRPCERPLAGELTTGKHDGPATGLVPATVYIEVPACLPDTSLCSNRKISVGLVRSDLRLSSFMTSVIWSLVLPVGNYIGEKL